MSGFNSIQTSWYADLVRRVFGEDLVLEGLSPELQVNAQLDTDPIEWNIFKKKLTWTTGQVSIAASVGNQGRVQILNPVGSNRIVVVTGVTVRVTAGTAVQMTIDAAAASTPTSNLALDTRLPLNVALGGPTVMSQNLIANNNAVVSGYTYDHRGVTANFWSGIVLPLEKPVLAPGHNFTVFDDTANDQLVAIITGYERLARPEELLAA